MMQYLQKHVFGDLDDTFCYDTVRNVRVLDRRLGIVYYAFFGIIVTYFFFNLVVKQAYLEMEKTSGWITCQIINSQKSDLGLYWDSYDRVTNPGEMGATFVPTKVVITKGQTETQGQYCQSLQHPCKVDDDCDIGNRQLQQKCNAGYCMRRHWCPAEDPENELGGEVTETHILDISDVEIWYKSFVHFHIMDLDVRTTDEPRPKQYPSKMANTYPLHDILRMAKVSDEEVIENGGIILMNAIFECQLDDETCDSYLTTANVDTVTGFNHVWNNFYYEDGVRKRDTYRMYGIRILTFATGIGKKISGVMVLMQFAAFIGMTTAASAIADLYMLKVIPERKNYELQKCIETEDFND